MRKVTRVKDIINVLKENGDCKIVLAPRECWAGSVEIYNTVNEIDSRTHGFIVHEIKYYSNCWILFVSW